MKKYYNLLSYLNLYITISIISGKIKLNRLKINLLLLTHYSDLYIKNNTTIYAYAILLGAKQSTVGQAIVALEKAEYLTKTGEKKGGKIVYILTNKGLSTVKKVIREQNKIYNIYS